ncbi:MAG: helix-turn-helix domain-containing protein [Candidatus Bathyarchaeota archaeon]|nr:helix-turn-helix domain-containing protein [Candidatus Bathyarchaeota archaeon]
MGRLSKKKRDRIRAMIQEGYTTKEIRLEVGCSGSTVTRVRKELNNGPQEKESTVESVLLKSLYQMHLGIEFNDILSEQELLNYFRECAISLTENILEADYEMAKKALFESDFFDYIMKLLKSKPEKVNRDDRQYRQRWIKILKKWYPEKLAELM